MSILTGTFQTAKASQYLQQLCKHFAHKVETRYTEHEGYAELPPGPARMHATQTMLTIRIDVQDDAHLPQAKHIIDSHLQRFAYRENFTAMDWQTEQD